MNRRLIILGAGGHGKVIADIASKNGYTDIAFLDDGLKGACMDFPVLGECARAVDFDDGDTDFIIGIGNCETRRSMAQKYPVNWCVLVHPSAQIATGASIGEGSVVMAGAIINSCAWVGNHCIINSASVVEHDNRIGHYAHISPGAVLGGSVCIGENTHVGIGAVIKNNVSVCNDCVIGAGAVVVRNITECGTYIGVPANKK